MATKTCDYFIIGAGIAGIGLASKLKGDVVMVDPNPFKYKIGESQVPNVVHAHSDVVKLIPKIKQMKSFNNKYGTIFADSSDQKYLQVSRASLSRSAVFHCERPEFEELLATELGVQIQQETIENIDLENNTVITNKHTYIFKKYIFDCSGPAMVLANKLGLVQPVPGYEDMHAVWGYWHIDDIHYGQDSWADWTVLNKIHDDTWLWQIPLFGGKVLSMGIVSKSKRYTDEEYKKLAYEYRAQCYEVSSFKKGEHKDYSSIHRRANYAKISLKASNDNWILVGDAFCFADPVYSVGTAVAMTEAVAIADYLNVHGKFDHEWYNEKQDALVDRVLKGFDVWYKDAWKDTETKESINKDLLRGGYFSDYKMSDLGVLNQRLLGFENHFIPYQFQSIVDNQTEFYFDENKFFEIENNGVLCPAFGDTNKYVRLKNKNIAQFFQQELQGKRFIKLDLIAMAEDYFLDRSEFFEFDNILRQIELFSQLYFYFDESKFSVVDVDDEQELRIGEPRLYERIWDPQMIMFFQQELFGNVLERAEIIKKAQLFFLHVHYVYLLENTLDKLQLKQYIKVMKKY